MRPHDAAVTLLRFQKSSFRPFFVVTLAGGRKLMNSKTPPANLVNRMRQQLPPGRIYGFGLEPYKESVTQLQCY